VTAFTVDPNEAVAGVAAALGFADVELEAVGFSNVVVRAGGQIVRVARTPAAGARQRSEASVLRAVAGRMSVAVPVLRGLVAASAALPHGAQVVSLIEGRCPSTEEARAETYLDDLGAFMAELHSIPVSTLPPDMPDWPYPVDGHTRRLRSIRPLLEDRLERSEVARIDSWWGKASADPAWGDFAPALRHGDLWWGNTLVVGGRLSGVVDWECAAVADAAEDLAVQTYLGQEAFRAVLAAYVESMSLSAASAASLARRARLYREIAEFKGIESALALADEPELDDAVEKLRDAPVLGGW
jgi:aminoglycoside phosphotransferase (APT) family kinase protein